MNYQYETYSESETDSQNMNILHRRFTVIRRSSYCSGNTKNPTITQRHVDAVNFRCRAEAHVRNIKSGFMLRRIERHGTRGQQSSYDAPYVFELDLTF